MKKVIISAIIIIAFIFYVGVKGSWFKFGSADVRPQSQASTSPNSSTDQSSSNTSDQSTNPVPPESPTPTPPQNRQYKDGSYTGSVADAFYGPLQVQAIMTNGQISDVKFLRYPNDQEHSREVSSFALPSLKQEAIQIQDSNVDIVSGATQTSEAFRQSMASALAQAKS
jgi:uncharacterized protein with FMN-binding domain